MSNINLVSCIAWVKRGFAKNFPKEYEMEEDEINALKEEPLIKRNLDKDINDIDENDDSQEEDGFNMPIFAAETQYLKKDQQEDDNEYPFELEDMDEEEKEDFEIKSTDSLLIAAKIEKEFSSLEIYVFDEKTSNLFVHHEITLSAFPLCLEWLSSNPATNEVGNFVIVGTFLPEIEIWDLDILNAIEPCLILGGEKQVSKKKVKKMKKQNPNFELDSHTDSVITIGLNQFRKNILCSGSADQTVKIWDLNTRKNLHTYKHHKGKVQVVKWNQQEEAILISGAYDKQLCLFDVRSPNSQMFCKLNSSIESLIFDPVHPTQIVISCEDGFVSQIDAKKFNLDYQFNFKAHDKETTSVSMSPKVSGMLATTSVDGTVKVWDTTQIVNGRPKFVTMKTPKSGKLFGGKFQDDNPWIYGCGNSNGEVFIWDTTEDNKIVQNFGDRVDKKIKPTLDQCTVGEVKPVGQKYAEDSEDYEDIEQNDQMEDEN